MDTLRIISILVCIGILIWGLIQIRKYLKDESKEDFWDDFY